MTSIESRRAEVATKLDLVRARMAARGLDAILLTTSANLAWVTAGGAAYINTATDAGVAAVIITPDTATLITDTIETPRLQAEEGLGDLGLTFVTEPWYARGSKAAELLRGQRAWGDDGSTPTAPDFTTDLRDQRTHLHPNEVARYREIGASAAAAMADAIRRVRPGMTEFEVAALLAAAAVTRGGLPIVNLVASDARIAAFRHPLPTDKTIERYVMLVLCLRRYGLIASITRLAHFGPLPADLQRRAVAVAQVEARMILGTQVGQTIGGMFALARTAYTEQGYPEAIEEHHQGGSTGYGSREVLARPDDPTPIALHQAFAWNPSVRGVKSEDTMLLGPTGPEILTAIDGWPTEEITSDGHTIARPLILER
ncbi:MAG: M24 family metallopeptidase [Ktedonobacterales bacterium]|nr:M24 family metallopeptidase [Ktedonobacterales bacterium]